jgi:mannosyl-3-phosphoglycerate phosphatase
MTQLLIFTDLDGTLLDHHTYSFAAALPALAEIKARKIPLILISSKTRAELLDIHKELELDTPFISENGAAIHWQESGQWQRQAFSQPRAEILTTLDELSLRFDYRFSGFAGASIKQISVMTGLSGEKPALAADREYTEPLIWQDTPERLRNFIAQLAERNLNAAQGGRFLSIMGQFDKFTAMRWLQERYTQEYQPQPVTCIALGDSHNDEAMLQQADIAVIIKSSHSDQLSVDKPEWIIRTTEPGPSGWQTAMAAILQRFNCITGQDL